MGAENCCKSVQIEQQENLVKKNSYSHPKQHIQVLRHLGQMQLLATISYQAQQVFSSQHYVSNIASNFYSLDQFIELIDNNFSSHSPFLHLLQSKVYHSNQPRYDCLENQCLANQICVIFRPSVPSSDLGESKLEKKLFQELKTKLKIVQLLRITQGELSKQDQFINTVCSTLHAIPDSQSYLWDITPKANISAMAKHLYYKLNSYIQLLNSYISLNDPLSLLNVKYYLQFTLRFICRNQEQKQSIVCKLNISQLEKQLLLKGNLMMTVNFLKFQKKNPQKLKTSNAQVLLILSQSNSKQNNKIRHMTNVYILPFTLFQIVEVTNQAQKTKIYLKELQDQFFLAHLMKPLTESSMQQGSFYVAITKQNVGTQLQSLKQKYEDNLQNYLQHHQTQQNSSDLSHIQQLISRYFEDYQKNRETKKNGCSGGEQKEETVTSKKQQQILAHKQNEGLGGYRLQALRQGEGAGEANRQEVAEVESESQMKQLNPAQIKKYENALSDYIKSLKFDKLQTQLEKVDRFYYLTSLNLSHCYLERVQQMGCFPNLKQLFLYSNQITKIEGLQNNLSLRLLSLSRNKIGKLENIKHLLHLRELYLTKNLLGKESAEYLASKQFKKLHSLSISFLNDREYCFQLICKQALFKLSKLVINQSQFIMERTKNKLRKKFNNATIQFCQ